MCDISIVLPVYNAEKNISVLIDSVINQTITDWNLIIVDDGSSDNTLDIIQKFSNTDRRITIFSQKNSGPATARNFGISKVKTPYITFIDADDKIREDYLELLLYPIKENPIIDLVCGGYYEQNQFNPDGIALHDFTAYKDQKMIDQSIFIQNLFNGLTGVLWSKLFKTSIIQDYKVCMPTNLKLSEDLIFVLRYAQHINKVALVFENIYYYNRLDDTGLSKKFDETYLDNFKIFNRIVLQEVNEDKEEVSLILDRRLGNSLLKTLKDQSYSSDNLKYYYELILNNFGSHIFNHTSAIIDKMFLFLLKNKFFFLAYIQQKTINYLRKLKHA